MDIILVKAEISFCLALFDGSAAQPVILDGDRYTFPGNRESVPSAVGGWFGLEGDPLGRCIASAAGLIHHGTRE